MMNVGGVYIEALNIIVYFFKLIFIIYCCFITCFEGVTEFSIEMKIMSRN